jgi:hypothetical protein
MRADMPVLFTIVINLAHMIILLGWKKRRPSPQSLLGATADLLLHLRGLCEKKLCLWHFLLLVYAPRTYRFEVTVIGPRWQTGIRHCLSTAGPAQAYLAGPRDRMALLPQPVLSSPGTAWLGGASLHYATALP